MGWSWGGTPGDELRGLDGLAQLGDELRLRARPQAAPQLGEPGVAGVFARLLHAELPPHEDLAVAVQQRHDASSHGRLSMHEINTAKHAPTIILYFIVIQER